jgi:hypothetical protein
MKVERFDGKLGRVVLTGMIVDASVLGRVAQKWTGDQFESKWENLIGGWCVAYMNKYGRPPRGAVEDLFEDWAGESGADKETVELVDKFLSSLSGEYARLAKERSSEYVLDKAQVLFDQVASARLARRLDSCLASGKVSKVRDLVNKFSFTEVAGSAGVDVLRDKAAIKDAFLKTSQPVITYPGALGNFFGDALERDGFVGFMAPEKRGKTWWLLDVAFRGTLQGRRVAFFQAGDLSLHQIMRRFHVRISKHPAKAGRVLVPTYIEPGKDCAEVTYEAKEFGTPLDWRRARRIAASLADKLGTDTPLRLSVHPNSTLSVAAVKSILDSWVRLGWVPDVVVIDYADILAPAPGYKESRDQINDTWKRLRCCRSPSTAWS